MSENSEMREKGKRLSRREVLVGGLSVAAGVIGGRGAEAAKKRTVETADRIPPNVRQFEGEIKVNDSLFKTGSAESIVRFLATESLGGRRPHVAPYNTRKGRYAYPPLEMAYKGAKYDHGWPTTLLHIRSLQPEGGGEEEALIATNATRIGESRFLIPANIFGRATGTREKTANIRAISLRPQGEDVNVPILDPLPAIRDEELQDGTYAVALGKTHPSDELENGDGNFGGYYLTGFLIRVTDKPALRGIIETTARKSGMNEERVSHYMSVVDDSYIMVGDMIEARYLHHRMQDGEDGLGQRVYVNTDGGGFKRAGFVHHAMFLTPAGDVYDEKSSSLVVPIYLVYGFSAISNALK